MKQNKMRILVYFASGCAIDNNIWNDLEVAVKHASQNLYQRYRLKLFGPYHYNQTSFTIQISGDIPDGFSPGPHLKGISHKLLKINSDFYNKNKIGKRLLHFCLINDTEGNLKLSGFETAIIISALEKDIQATKIDMALHMTKEDKRRVLDDLEPIDVPQEEMDKLVNKIELLNKIKGELR